jgi:hypothetical protein
MTNIPQDITESREALLPCPFCGSEAKEILLGREDYIECDNKNCGNYGNAIATAKAWNTRQQLAKPVDEWMPIETAPKDGSIFLGAKDDDVLPCRWIIGDDDGVDCMGSDDGFCDLEFNLFIQARSFGNHEYRSIGNQPTHWQPLPAPPAKATTDNLGEGT